MTDYTPTTEEVRDAYVVGMEHDCYWEGDVKLTPDGVYEANRFNAWLTEYTRVKQAEAWERERERRLVEARAAVDRLMERRRRKNDE